MRAIILLFLITLLTIPSIASAALADDLSGKILLQVEENGEAWYVNPDNSNRYYMGRPSDAFALMREFGLGISTENLNKIPIGLIAQSGADYDKDGLVDLLENAIGTDFKATDSDHDGYSDKEELANGYNPNGEGEFPANIDHNLVNRLKGKILLQVEKNGEAWYVNPENSKRYFLGRPVHAFEIMRGLGLGITNTNLDLIPSNILMTTYTKKDDFSIAHPLNWYLTELAGEEKKISFVSTTNGRISNEYEVYFATEMAGSTSTTGTAVMVTKVKTDSAMGLSNFDFPLQFPEEEIITKDETIIIDNHSAQTFISTYKAVDFEETNDSAKFYTVIMNDAKEFYVISMQNINESEKFDYIEKIYNQILNSFKTL